MDKCSLCGGKVSLMRVQTSLSGFNIDVNAYKCDECGEEFMEK